MRHDEHDHHGQGGHEGHGAHDHHDHGGRGHAGHGHSHGLGHVHAPANFGKAFAIGVALNAGFVVLEVVYGLLGHSVALIADGGHNLSDVLGLGVAWAAVVLAKRAPTDRFTFGLGGTSILAALSNAVLLLVVIAILTWEAIRRFYDPQPVEGVTVMVVAAIGIVINGFCAWLFSSGGKDDLNVRGAFMHMAADALVSVGVVAGGAVILLTGWQWVDPVVTLVINAVIVWGTWPLLKGSVAMSLNGTPPGVDLDEVRGFLSGLPGVAGLRDLHVWSLSTTDTALTCHLVMPEGPSVEATLGRAAEGLEERFGIGRVTLQPVAA